MSNRPVVLVYIDDDSDDDFEPLAVRGQPTRATNTGPTTNPPAATTTRPVVDIRALLSRRSDPAAPTVRAAPVPPRRTAPEPASSHVRPTPALARPNPHRNEFIGAPWPQHVVHLAANFNPNGVSFPYVAHFGVCRCEQPCRLTTCRNARVGMFCTPDCCEYGGHCGNSVPVVSAVSLARNQLTQELGLIATRSIDEGVIVGEYLGKLVQASSASMRNVRNTGYRLQMRQEPHGSGRAYLDAEHYGSLLRFMNHSCEPAAIFYPLSNGRQHKIVAVTCRKVHPGEELTVDYGEDLWFVCRCGASSCRHQDLDAANHP